VGPALIRFQAPQIPPAHEVAAYFALAENARWYSNGGPCHELLVERLERYLGPGVSCIPVANATLGLMVALRAMTGFAPRRREVLMPSFTFVAMVDAVLWAGLEPVFVDVDPHSWHLDPAALDTALESRSDAVAVVLAASTFGTPPAISQRKAWQDAAARAGVPLLVDSAAGFGATDERGERLARQGNAEVFSFHATKPFAVGEGGLVTTTDPMLARRLRRLINFGLDAGIVSDDVGLNAKLAEWPAATALAVLDGYENVLAARRASAQRMLDALAPYGYVCQGGAERSVWQFVPVLAPSPEIRAAALERASTRGIQLRTYFSVPLHRMPAFASSRVIGDLANTRQIASRVLSLPMANDLSEADAEAIVACLQASGRSDQAPARSARTLQTRYDGPLSLDT
jgi:dTDP-4-amino-4,6-dideoxygalactose transaminase